MFRRPKVPASITMPRWWRRHGVTLCVVAILASLALSDRLFQHPQATTSDRARYHDKTFRVVKVVDGDTLDIDVPDGNRPTTRIRLWGVDTPEVHGHERSAMYFGPEASMFAKKVLLDKDVHVVLSEARTRGKYGRLLAYVFLERDGAMFNEMLLEKGYAYADFRFPHHYFDRFKAIEKHARRIRAGLWANVTVSTMPPWRQRFERQTDQKRN